MPTFVNVVATTAATTIAAVGTACPYGVVVANLAGNTTGSIIRVANTSTGIATQGYPIPLNQSTLISPYQCSSDAGNIWIYANTTGQTLSVIY